MKRWLVLVLWAASLPAAGQSVQANGAWARATVPGQHATGAFMSLTAPQGARLVGAASPVAGLTEIHEMKMQGNVMTMRAVDAVDLPPGRTVQLAPGGYHLMLMDLQRALVVGEQIRVELRFETRDRRAFTQPIEVEVRRSAPAPASAN